MFHAKFTAIWQSRNDPCPLNGIKSFWHDEKRSVRLTSHLESKCRATHQGWIVCSIKELVCICYSPSIHPPAARGTFRFIRCKLAGFIFSVLLGYGGVGLKHHARYRWVSLMIFCQWQFVVIAGLDTSFVFHAECLWGCAKNLKRWRGTRIAFSSYMQSRKWSTPPSTKDLLVRWRSRRPALGHVSSRPKIL